MATLDELTTPLTVDEVRAAIYASLAAQGTTVTGWKPGAIARTIITAVAILGSALSYLQATIAKGGFLELASGPWLTLLAYYSYGVDRDLGSFAAGVVTLDNAGGGVYAGDPGDLIVLNSLTGKTYRNTEAFSIGALQTGVEVDIEAIEIGSDSSSAAGDIDELETTLLGVSVTNAAAIIGADEETDPELRIRCRAKTGALSPNGPRDAYRYIALSTKSAAGASIGVTRTRTVADGFGGLTLYVATASGPVTGTAGDPSTNLGAINAAIQTQCEPLAVTATTASASALTVAVTYEIWIRDTVSMTEAEVEDAIEAALETFMAGQPIAGEVISPSSGKVYVEAIKAAIVSPFPASVIDLEVTTPAADAAVGSTQAPVLGTVSATVHLVSAST